MHYKVQFTADQEYIELLEEARDLLAHVNPTRDIVEVQRRALEVLVTRLRKRKHADRSGAARDRAEPTCTGPEQAEPAPGTSRRAGAERPPIEQPQEPGTAGDVAAATVPAQDGARDGDALIPSAGLTASREAARPRRPGAAIARAVWQRDRGRCTYIDERGQRCRETSRLEYHHEQAFALGGATSADNLTLRCRAHNALAAEQEFGREHIAHKRCCDRQTMTTP